MKIKVLFVGNSFAVNTASFMHQIAEMMGVDLYVAVLFIGGCPISLHLENINNDAHAYEIYVNGNKDPLLKNASIMDAINLQNEWDYISFQQRSGDSVDVNTFFPDLTILSNKIRQFSNATFMLNQTWSYAKDFSHSKYGSNPLNQEAMDNDIIATYKKVEEITGFFRVPVGESIMRARKIEGDIFCSDGYHLNENGCVIASLTWCQKIIDNSLNTLDFNKYNLPIEIDTFKRYMDYVLSK